MIQYWRFELDEVLPYVPNKWISKIRKEYLWYNVKMSSDRLLVFTQNISCVECWRTWTHFILESHLENDIPHFNLYSDDGILMTKDHIIPVSKGWPNTISNYQTMCKICNERKSNYYEPNN